MEKIFIRLYWRYQTSDPFLSTDLLHLLENRFDRKRNPLTNSNPNANINSNPNSKTQ